MNNKKVVIIIGPPGSGKGTQAELISNKYNLFHFDSGRILENIFYFNDNIRKNSIIKKEKKLFDAGKLNTPSFVLKIFKDKVNKLYNNDSGIVFSGSPRTFYEAFGDNKTIGLIDELERLYGRKNIIIFVLNVPENVSIYRNSRRVLCSVCGMPIINMEDFHITSCPFCGGKLRKRSLDKPNVIKIRLKEYENRTIPVIKELEKHNFIIHNINGTPLPYKVFKSISNILNDIFKVTSRN